MTKLNFPFTEETIRAQKVGDEVLISGIVFTGREARGWIGRMATRFVEFHRAVGQSPARE